jgi:hypothetical protein
MLATASKFGQAPLSWRLKAAWRVVRGIIAGMAPPTLPLARRVEPEEPTHACIRCGRPGVPAELALCEQCNPLELAQPSATQVHGIAALGIILFVVLLAVLGRGALAGAGPFIGAIDGVSPTATGLSVSMVVTNKGTKAAATTCSLVLDSHPIGGVRELVQTPVIPAGSSLRFSAEVTKCGTAPVGLATDCQTP